MSTLNSQTNDLPQEPSRFCLGIKRLYLLLLVSTLACNVLHADVRAESKAQKIETLLQTAHSRGQFNGTALAGDKGQIIYTGAIGYADFDKKIPLTTDSIFELASVSKPFTALAIMMLKERGKLSYDDPLTKFFPELP
jgi:CubicO group peptidase (beta-lactamase class C family)